MIWLLPLLLGCERSPPAPSPAPAPPASPAHAGSTRCAACHEDAATAWRTSTHARAALAVDAARRDPAAGVDAAFPDPAAPTIHLDGVAAPLAVTRLLGVEPLWQPLVVDPDGTDGAWQVSSRAFHPASGAWFDVFDDPRERGDFGHWTGPGMTWNRACAPCHGTGVDVGWSPEAGRYDTRIDEHGVGCEACHGLGSTHAADPTAAPPPLARPGAETCLPCHTRGELLGDGVDPGAPLLDQAIPARPAGRGLFHPDGGIRDELFEGVPFALSRMAAAGVTCLDCHEPHGGGLRRDGDALCATCHPDGRDHAHHTPAQATCVDCHMRTQVYMQRDPRHDHGFHRPDPVHEAERGIPSACSACHALDEVTEAAASWWAPAADRRRRAAALGDPARTAEALAAETHPRWRAVLVGQLPAAHPSVAEAGAADDPWLRLAAAETLAPDDPAAAPLRTDPVPAVRHAAMHAALPRLGAAHSEVAERRRHLEARTDDPAAAVALGAGWMAAGRPDRAAAAYRAALARAPREPGVSADLAVALATMGDLEGAESHLDAALALAPDDPEARFRRALARAGRGDVDGAEADLRAVLEADPAHLDAAGNLALLLHGAGRTDEGLGVLGAASEARPEAARPRLLLAYLHRDAGRLDAARTAVSEALARSPDDADAQALARSLGLSPPPGADAP